jgi:hypothetical protein
MKTVVASTKYLSIALAAAAFVAFGSASAFAQSRDHTGSMMPTYYDNAGGQVTDGSWGKQQAAPAARHQALRPSRQLIQDAGRSNHNRVQ